LTAVLIALACPALALADHDKVDKLLMANGDLLTCEVIRLSRGILTVKGDGLGTISVEWRKVVSLTSPVQYDVENAAGIRFYGSLVSTQPGHLQIGAGGPDLPLMDVVELTPVDTHFWQQLDGSIDAGFSFAQANHQTQWSLNANASRRTNKFLTSISGSSILTDNDETTQQSRNTIGLAVQRLLPARWFAAVLAQVDQNEQLGLTVRSVSGGGAGRALVQSNRAFLAPFGGIVYTHEQYEGQDGTDRAEVVFGTRADWFTFGDRSLDFSASEQTYLDVEDLGRVRVEVDANVKRKVVKDLYWAVTFLESFNSAPPAGNKKNDLAVTISFGWAF
jgi:hypothetical protein